MGKSGTGDRWFARHRRGHRGRAEEGRLLVSLSTTPAMTRRQPPSPKSTAFPPTNGMYDYEACGAGVAKVVTDLGPIEVLVNNAGITRDGMFHKMTPADWNAVINTNLTGLFNMTHPVWGGMRDRSFGRVINISSINGQKGQMGQVNYSAAKAGDLGFTKALAQEGAAKGITVNAICPGYIGTEMVRAVPKRCSTSASSRISRSAARRARGSRALRCVPGLRRRWLHHGVDAFGERRAVLRLAHPPENRDRFSESTMRRFKIGASFGVQWGRGALRSFCSRRGIRLSRPGGAFQSALPPRGDGRVALQCVVGYGVSAGQRHNSRPAVTLILALTRVAKSGPQASAAHSGVVPREFARTPGTGLIPAQKRGQIRHHSGVPERNFVCRSQGWRSGEDFLVHVSSCRLHTPGQFLLRERRS